MLEGPRGRPRRASTASYTPAPRRTPGRLQPRRTAARTRGTSVAGPLPRLRGRLPDIGAQGRAYGSDRLISPRFYQIFLGNGHGGSPLRVPVAPPPPHQLLLYRPLSRFCPPAGSTGRPCFNERSAAPRRFGGSPRVPRRLSGSLYGRCPDGRRRLADQHPCLILWGCPPPIGNSLF